MARANYLLSDLQANCQEKREQTLTPSRFACTEKVVLHRIPFLNKTAQAAYSQRVASKTPISVLHIWCLGACKTAGTAMIAVTVQTPGLARRAKDRRRGCSRLSKSRHSMRMARKCR